MTTLEKIAKELGIDDIEEARYRDDLENKLDTETDFYFEIGCCDYRLIHNSVIWNIYVDEIRDMVEECYMPNLEIAFWIVIDWEKTAENCLGDGYGYTFASYDGDEMKIDDWHIFRVI